MENSSFVAVVNVLTALQELSIPYMLVGSFSSNYYSYPRATKDADIEIRYSTGDLNRLRDRLSDDFALEQQMSFETLTGTIRNVLTYKPSDFDIELFRLGNDPHHQVRFERRRSVDLPQLEITATIPTPEDVIIQKLRWQREKDLDDARKVLQIQFAKLDWQYLRTWTDQHDTSKLLEQLKSEAKND